MRSEINRRRGFTLVEALVSFAILVLVLSQLLSGISGAARNDARADFLLHAAREGQSHLAALGEERALALGESDGEYDGDLRWKLIVSPYNSSGPGRDLRPVTVFVRLSVRSQREPSLQLVLSTVKSAVIENGRQAR